MGLRPIIGIYTLGIVTPAFLIGILGSFLLVAGAACPDRKVTHAYQSSKDWLLAAGGVVMFVYAFLNYVQGGPVFYVFLQGQVVLSSIFMMLDLDERISMPVIIIVAILLVGWSLALAHTPSTFWFIAGLAAISGGFVMPRGGMRRELALLLGSAMIAIFSFLASSWLFFWLNILFSGFSGYYILAISRKS